MLIPLMFQSHTAATPASSPSPHQPNSSQPPVSASPAPIPDRVSTFAALRIRNYRLFFAGQAVSNTGTWMQRIAQDWLVLQLTNSPLAVGITVGLQFAPMLFLGLFGGLIADRFSKRQLLMLTQSVMCVLAGVLAALTLAGVVRVWHVYLIALALGVVTVVDNPARQTFVNEMVPQHLVRNAVGLNSGNFQLARMVGPAVAGVLISVIGTGWTFGLNAASYLGVLAGLAMMRPADLVRQARATAGPGQLREGLRFVRSRPDLIATIVLVFFVGTFGFNFAIILSAYAKNVFHSGAGVYGLLNTVMAGGSVLGALVAARRTTSRLAGLVGAAVGFSALLMVLGGLRWLPAFMAVLFVTGLVSITFNTLGNSTIQLGTPAALRGRVMSLYMLVFLGSTPIGSLLVGWITDRWGAPTALVITGAICLVATTAVGAIIARRNRVTLHVDLHRGEPHLQVVPRAAAGPVRVSSATG